jgi:DDE family transposase
MRSNQVRRYFSSFAYILVHTLRRLGLEGTELAEAQCDTIRTKLFNIGARETLSSEGYLAVSGK